jgi:hypothetical protein
MPESFVMAQERVKELQSGEPVERPVEEYKGWHFGELVRVLEDHPGGPNVGDEGTLVLQEVGSPEYGNVRIDVSILLDGWDCPMDVNIAAIEAA